MSLEQIQQEREVAQRPERKKTPELLEVRVNLLDAIEGLSPHEALELLAETKETLDAQIKKRLVQKAFEQMDRLHELAKSETDLERVKSTLRPLMESMAKLAKQIPPEHAENAQLWRTFHNRFYDLVVTKTKAEPPVARAFDEIFQEFSDFIDDEFVTREIERQKYTHGFANSAEAAHTVYGRTQEEVEVVKRQNRKSVVEEIAKLKDEPYFSIETLEKLYAINNKGIVPRRHSKIRGTGEESEYGAARVGIMGEDVRTEMAEVMKRVEDVIDRSLIEDWSDARYEIAVAKLHNEILDIHPFSDRNGSTALLFIELMMARRGYVPSPKHETNYYRQLRQALDNNPVAIGIVGYEQYKVAHMPGYYAGETTKQGERPQEYAVSMQKRVGEWKAAKRAAKAA